MSSKYNIGTVVNNAMNKTIVIKINSRYPHPMYAKTLVRTKTYLVHDEYQQCKIGDKILAQESRPLSKRKWYKFLKTVSKSKLI